MKLKIGSIIMHLVTRNEYVIYNIHGKNVSLRNLNKEDSVWFTDTPFVLNHFILLPTLEEPPTWAPHVNTTRDVTELFWGLGLTDVVTEKPEGIQSEAALKFIEATKKQVDIGMIKMLKCAHDRATYDSGWSKYDYCKKCDYKFKEDDK